MGSYNTSVKPMIDQWIDETTKIKDQDKLVIVFCVTAEVRSKRSRIKISSKYESVEECIVKDYRAKCRWVWLGCGLFYPLIFSVTNVRLSSADDSRIADSFASYSLEINRLALNNFLSRLSDVSGELRHKRIRTVDSNEVYDLLCKKVSVSFLLPFLFIFFSPSLPFSFPPLPLLFLLLLLQLSLSVCYEMIRDPLQASTRYASVHDDLETAITVLSRKDNGESSSCDCHVIIM